MTRQPVDAGKGNAKREGRNAADAQLAHDQRMLGGAVGILAGGATDPNSGLLVILFALIYWPLTSARRAASGIVIGEPSLAEDA